MYILLLSISSFVLLVLMSFIITNQTYMWIPMVVVSWVYLIPVTEHLKHTHHLPVRVSDTVPRLVFALLVASYFKITTKEPTDTLLYCIIPLWIGLNMHLLAPYVDLSLSKKINLKSPWLYLFVLFALGTILFQWLEWRQQVSQKKLLMGTYIVIGIIVIITAISLIFEDLLSLHLHHYIVGAIGMFYFQGPHVVSIILGNLYFGVFLNGVLIWGPDPLWEPR